VFVYEPFDFKKELARARREPVFGKESAAIVSYETLLDLKKSAGRSQDLLDVEKLRKLNSHRKRRDQKTSICPSGMEVLYL
jgi:hypothetical protein